MTFLVSSIHGVINYNNVAVCQEMRILTRDIFAVFIDIKFLLHAYDMIYAISAGHLLNALLPWELAID